MPSFQRRQEFRLPDEGSSEPLPQEVAFEFKLDIDDAPNNKGMLNIRYNTQDIAEHSVSFDNETPIALNANRSLDIKGQWGTETQIYFVDAQGKHNLKNYSAWLSQNSLKTTNQGLKIVINFNNDCPIGICQGNDDIITSKR